MMTMNRPSQQRSSVQDNPRKALFSSPMACASVVANRLKRLESRKDHNSQSQINELESLLLALNNIDASQFSKYQLLLDTIRKDLARKANNTEDRW